MRRFHSRSWKDFGFQRLMSAPLPAKVFTGLPPKAGPKKISGWSQVNDQGRCKGRTSPPRDKSRVLSRPRPRELTRPPSVGGLDRCPPWPCPRGSFADCYLVRSVGVLEVGGRMARQSDSDAESKVVAAWKRMRKTGRRRGYLCSLGR